MDDDDVPMPIVPNDDINPLDGIAAMPNAANAHIAVSPFDWTPLIGFESKLLTKLFSLKCSHWNCLFEFQDDDLIFSDLSEFNEVFLWIERFKRSRQFKLKALQLIFIAAYSYFVYKSNSVWMPTVFSTYWNFFVDFFFVILKITEYSFATQWMCV